MLFYGKVTKNLKIKLVDSSAFKVALQEMRGFPITLQLLRSSKQRSNNQNKYFHGVILPLVWRDFVNKGVTNEAGVKPTQLDVKEFLKNLFLKTEMRDREEREIGVYTKGTSKLSTDEFEDFCEKCRQWAAEKLDLQIPMPNETTISEHFKR